MNKRLNHCQQKSKKLRSVQRLPMELLCTVLFFVFLTLLLPVNFEKLNRSGQQLILSPLIKLSIANAQSRSPEDIKNFINDLAIKVIALVRAPISFEEYSKRMIQLVDKHAVYDQLVVYVLGPYNRQITDDERVRFRAALSSYFQYFFVKQFKGYKGQKIIVSEPTIGKNEVYTIAVKFLPVVETGTTLNTEWRLWYHDNDYKVLDIAVNGISMISVQRAEMTTILNNGNGDINLLIARLNERVEKFKSDVKNNQ